MAALAHLGRRRAGLALAAALSVLAATVAVIPSLIDPSIPFGGLVVGFVTGYGAVVYVLVGVAVLWRRPGHGIGRLALVVGLGFSVSILLSSLVAWLGLPAALGLASEAVLLIGWVAGGSLLVVWFPSGHRTSRLGGLVEGILVLVVIAMIATSGRDDLQLDPATASATDSLFAVAEIVGFGGLAIAYFASFIDLAIRYRPADPLAQTQMRWVLAAEAVSLATFVAMGLFGERLDWLFVVWFASMGLPVLAIAVALTRYHLYEIDRIISRSISYLVVTTVLIAVFATIVLVLQAAISAAVAGPGTTLDPRVVAVSTLAVAALFNPLRNRVQAAVDRRFHRQRYDGGRLVAGFGGRMRDQVDLPTVRRELRATTVEALHPATTGIWLRSRIEHL